MNMMNFSSYPPFSLFQQQPRCDSLTTLSNSIYLTPGCSFAVVNPPHFLFLLVTTVCDCTIFSSVHTHACQITGKRDRHGHSISSGLHYCCLWQQPCRAFRFVPSALERRNVCMLFAPNSDAEKCPELGPPERQQTVGPGAARVPSHLLA